MKNIHLKPKKCCEVGTFKHQISMPINGRRQGIDLCISDIVAALNAANIKTIASCCGHSKLNGLISLEDGRNLIITERLDKELIATKKTSVLGMNLSAFNRSY